MGILFRTEDIGPDSFRLIKEEVEEPPQNWNTIKSGNYAALPLRYKLMIADLQERYEIDSHTDNSKWLSPKIFRPLGLIEGNEEYRTLESSWLRKNHYNAERPGNTGRILGMIASGTKLTIPQVDIFNDGPVVMEGNHTVTALGEMGHRYVLCKVKYNGFLDFEREVYTW